MSEPRGLEARGQAIPIIVVTAKTLTAEDRDYLSGSVERLLHKGDQSLDELLSTLAEMLPANGAAAAAESP